MKTRLIFLAICLTLALRTVSPAQTVVPLPDRTLVKLLSDSGRSRIYGLNRGNGTLPGTLLEFDGTNGAVVKEIALGLNPTDMAMTGSGDAVYVVNTGDRTLMKVGLNSFTVDATRSIVTPNTYNPANPLHLATGRSNIVYFTDGGWAPGITVFDFSSGSNLAEWNPDGVGGLALTRDGRNLYFWRQYGWGAGSVVSWVGRVDAKDNAPVAKETSFVSWRRDPYDTPLLLDEQETVLFNKQQMFRADDVSVLLQEFAENIYAISRRGDLAFGNSKVFVAATGLAVTNLPFSSTVQALSGDDRSVFLYSASASELVVHPLSLLVGAGWETNRPPVAAFVRMPGNATTLDTIAFDASDSTDDQGSGSALEYRWDWENDGGFDTAFTNSPVAAHRYNIAGTKTVTLQVKDRYGTISTKSEAFDVVQEDDPGQPGGGNPLFEVQFAAADIAFDPVRPYAYISGYDTRKLAMLNLTNGLIERQFDFDWNAESIAVSPNGKKMYVALLKQPHRYWGTEPYTNYIAEFDLGQRVKTKEFQILADPYDMVVTDGGILIVPGGSDQWTDIRTYRTSTGEQLGSSGIRHRSRISLHPSQQAVYTADTDVSPSDIQRYTFDPVSGAFLSSWDSPYHGDYPMSGNVWCHPNGTNVIVRGGGVFSSSAVRSQDLLYQSPLEGGAIEAAEFDAVHGALFTLADDQLRYSNLKTYEIVSSQTLDAPANYLHATSNHIFVAWVDGTRTRFQRLPNPSVGAETNQPPMATFARTPENATTKDTIIFDASGSTDDQSSDSLEYRWDWENDGGFDTAFTNSPLVGHRFNIAGTKTVTLQVKDRFGAISAKTTTINVSQADDSGQPGGGNPLFEVQFAAADVAFDPVRPYAYISGYDTKKLAMLNLTNGLVERQFDFDWNAESIAVSPNGKKMYVALLRRPHNPYWFGGHTNYIAEFDLEQRVKTKEFQILADPYDLVVTDGGILVVPGGSDQWTDIRTYRTSTGQMLGSTSIRQESRIALHPSQQAVYTADTDSSPSDIQRYAFDPVTGVFLSSWDSPYHGDYPMSGNVWCHPNGTNVIVRGGGVFSSATARSGDLVYLRSLSGGRIDSATFDREHNAFFTVADNKLRQFNLNTYQLESTRTLSNTVSYVHVAGRSLYVASVQQGRTVFQRVANPALPDAAIVQQPESQTVTAGGLALLSVTPGGTPPFSFRWYFKGYPIPGETNASLVMNQVPASADGDYQVAVMNSFGSVTSSIAHLTVLVPSMITRQPENIAVPAGGVARFDVEASGSAPFRFQWFRNGSTLVGATNSELVVTDVQIEVGGSYQVTVQNSVGIDTSKLAVLRILPSAPSVAVSPANQSVAAGSNAVFSATASGTYPLGYQWYFGSVLLPGETGPNLTIQNVQPGHAGLYRVAVSNSVGQAESATVSLEVTPSTPWFTTQPTPTVAAAGSTITLRSLAQGSDPIAYQWRKNGTNLPSGDVANLSLSNALVDDSGSYFVVASNFVGVTTSTVVTVVITGAPPVFSVNLAGGTLTVGKDMVLKVMASGSPEIQYRWFFNGTNLPTRTNATEIFQSVSAAAGGSYFAVASNAFGVATSFVAKVTVKEPPILQVGLTNMVADAGSEVRLVVAASGASPIHFAWSFNGVPVTNSNGAELLIANAHPKDSGVYRVVISNGDGSTDAAMALTVFRSPGVVVGWGDNGFGQSRSSSGLDSVVQLAGGDFHSLALRRDGKVVGWGDNGSGQTTVPTNLTRTVALAAGAAHSLALQLDGRVSAWGRNLSGQTLVPANATSVVAIAAGEAHSVALRRDGSVVVWGDNRYQQNSVPFGIGYAVAVSSGRYHVVALRNNGTVIAWGLNSSGQTSIPVGLNGVQMVAAGYLHSLALKADGTVVAWGDNTFGQSSVPPGLSNVVSISAGDLHSVAVKADGTVVAWGDDEFGQTDVPPSLSRVDRVWTGNYHSLAIVPSFLFHSVTQEGMVLWWNGRFTLQQATNVMGPYQDQGDTGPFTNNWSTSPGRFFRLRSSE